MDTLYVNPYLREGFLRAQKYESHIKKEIHLLDGIFSRAQPITGEFQLFRGAPLSQNLHEKKGESYVDPAFVSTSLDPHVARNFANKQVDQDRVIDIIDLPPEGVKGIYLPGINGDVSVEGEREVILQRGLHFTVVDSIRVKEQGHNLVVRRLLVTP